MGFRDNMRKRARKGFKSLLKRAIDFAEEQEEEVVAPPRPPSKPPKPTQTKAKSPKPTQPQGIVPPPPSVDVTPGSADDDPGSLLQQLAESTTMSNDIVRRLRVLGLAQQAQDIVGATVGRSLSEVEDISTLGQLTNIAMKQSREALKAALEALNITSNLDSRARELKSKAERLSESANQYADDVQAKVDALTKKVEEMESKLGFDRVGADNEYDWNRKPVYIGFRSNPTAAFDELVKMWKKLSIGVKRRDGIPVGKSPFAPRAYARSSDVSLPQKIPLYAFSSPQAFKIWAEDNNFGKGLAIEIDGIIYGTSGLASIR